MFMSKQEFLRAVFPKSLKWRLQALNKSIAAILMTPLTAYEIYARTLEELRWDQDKNTGKK